MKQTEVAALFHLRPVRLDGDHVFGLVNGVLVAIVVASMLYPFVYILSLSLSAGAAAASGQVLLWPSSFTFAAYSQVLTDRLFWMAYGNTLIYAIGGTAMSLALIIPGAYALSRPQLMGRRVLNFLVAFTLAC